MSYSDPPPVKRLILIKGMDKCVPLHYEIQELTSKKDVTHFQVTSRFWYQKNLIPDSQDHKGPVDVMSNSPYTYPMEHVLVTARMKKT